MRLSHRSALVLAAALLGVTAPALHGSAHPSNHPAVSPSLRLSVPASLRSSADSDLDQPPGLYFKGAPVVPAVLRGLGVGTLMGSVGLLALLAWLLPAGGGAPRRAATTLGWVAVVFLVLHLVAWMLNASLDQRLDADALALLTSTDAGHAEIIRMALVFLAAVAATAVPRPVVGAVLGLGALVASAHVGHAATMATDWSLPAKALHLLAGATWLGGLLWLLLADPSLPEHAFGVGRVSGAALASVVVVTVTGFIVALLFLPSWRDLFHSDYGAVAIAKTVGVGILVLFGAYHKFVLVPRATEAATATKLRRSVRYEVLVMTFVILLGGLLAYISPPEHVG
ncbi:MAG TPA: CopD family protein [Gemmatimonadales bacterium]|nr:CopD family protein [Gemmatimonadales bacterium]